MSGSPSEAGRQGATRTAQDLGALQDAVLERLRAKHDAREATLTASRTAIRFAANAIRAIHRDEQEQARALLSQSAEALAGAQAACAAHPEVEHAGFLSDAQKEHAEAATTMALVTGAPLPTPHDLGVTDAAYLNGLAETVGELRRHLLDQLRRGALEHAEGVLGHMEDIYALLVTIDFPDGVTSGLRRSTDVARSILERTRGDLTTALVQARLQRSLDEHRAALERS